jgi:hypothetical protein
MFFHFRPIPAHHAFLVIDVDPLELQITVALPLPFLTHAVLVAQVGPELQVDAVIRQTPIG